MSLRPGWSGKLLWGYESTLGSCDGSSYKLWHTEESDSLVLGDVVLQRKPSVGLRWSTTYNFTKTTQNPSGGPGSIPIYFSADGSHLDLLHLLQVHFQNSAHAFPVGGIAPSSYQFGPLATAEPTTWRGISFLRDWGLESGIHDRYYRWSGGVIESLVFSWKSGDTFLLKPSFQFFNATNSGSGDTMDTTVYALPVVVQPYLNMYWNGTAIMPESVEFSSKNTVLGQIPPFSSNRTAFCYSDWGGVLKLSTWIDDDFYNRYVSIFNTGRIGTFSYALQGTGTYASTGSRFTITGTMYCKLNSNPALALKRGAGIETMTFDMVSPDGIIAPFKMTVWSNSLNDL